MGLYTSSAESPRFDGKDAGNTGPNGWEDSPPAIQSSSTFVAEAELIRGIDDQQDRHDMVGKRGEEIQEKDPGGVMHHVNIRTKYIKIWQNKLLLLGCCSHFSCHSVITSHSAGGLSPFCRATSTRRIGIWGIAIP